MSIFVVVHQTIILTGVLPIASLITIHQSHNSHNAPVWNRNVHISVLKWCIVGYETSVLWDLRDWSINWVADLKRGTGFLFHYRANVENKQICAC